MATFMRSFIEMTSKMSRNPAMDRIFVYTIILGTIASTYIGERSRRHMSLGGTG